MNEPKRALITGITGQDGAYLAKLLLDKGYHVFGAARRSSSGNLWRLDALGIRDRVRVGGLELLEPSTITAAIRKIRPHEVYNLAAQSFVGSSFDTPVYTANVNALGALHILEAIREVDPEIRFYQASTSEMFGGLEPGKEALDERSPLHPRSPYAVAKVFAHHATVYYREAFGLHASSGILFNHESPLRGSEFVTQRIVRGVHAFKQSCADGGPPKILSLGNLSAARDWGYAGDYVDAMWRMLQQPEGGDYVVATGVATTVEQFVDRVALQHGLEFAWAGEGEERKAMFPVDRGHWVAVDVDRRLYRPLDVPALVGDATKARTVLGWAPTVQLGDLVERMITYRVVSHAP